MTSVFDGLSDIFTETLGESVVYTPRAGDGVTIAVIIEEAPAMAVFAEADVTSHRVTGHARTSDVPDIAEGDSILTGMREFMVTEPIDSDGKGMTTFNLARKTPA